MRRIDVMSDFLASASFFLDLFVVNRSPGALDSRHLCWSYKACVVCADSDHTNSELM
jgi:hypothetical protein